MLLLEIILGFIKLKILDMDGILFFVVLKNKNGKF